MDTFTVKFTNVTWPKFSLPTSFTKDIRKDFFYDKDGQMFGYNDLHDILEAYLHDEYNVVPLSFDFDIQLN